jgi:hypothetical protein
MANLVRFPASLFAIRNGSTAELVSDFGAYTSGSLSLANSAHLAAIPLSYENVLALIDI